MRAIVLGYLLYVYLYVRESRLVNVCMYFVQSLSFYTYVHDHSHVNVDTFSLASSTHRMFRGINIPEERILLSNVFVTYKTTHAHPPTRI